MYNEQCFHQCLKENYTFCTNLQEMIFLSQPKPSQLKQSIKIHFTGKLMSLGTRLPGGIHVLCKHLQFHK